MTASPARADTLAHRIAALEPAMTVMRPEGHGPFPVVVMLHGCGGRQPFLEKYAQAAVDGGAAAVIVDSFAHRGISNIQAYATVCTGMRLQGRERAGDLFATMAWLRAQPWADGERLIAAGWSHGGWTILDALALRPGAEMRRATGLSDLAEEPLTGLAGALFLYPYAGRASYAGRRPWRIAPDAVAIISGRDYIVGANYPRNAFERLRAGGAPIEVHVFETATHAFDSDEAIDMRVRYDPAAAARAEGLMRDLITRVRANGKN